MKNFIEITEIEKDQFDNNSNYMGKIAITHLVNVKHIIKITDSEKGYTYLTLSNSSLIRTYQSANEIIAEINKINYR